MRQTLTFPAPISLKIYTSSLQYNIFIEGSRSSMGNIICIFVGVESRSDIHSEQVTYL